LYYDLTQIGAYAIWAKANGRTIRHSGLLKQKVSGSSLAETMALVNGICHTLTELRPGPGSKIIAQTDCRTVIEILSMPELRRAKTRKNFGPLRAVFLDRVAAAAVTVEFRHVRGHKGTETTGNAVNTWCNQECRRLMRAARDRELANASTPQSAALAT
jgi:hypothetical protein